MEDSVDIQQFVVANWVSLGDVTLDKGLHLFTIQLVAKPGEKVTAAFDCFLLAPGPFEPRGKAKPDEKSGLADPGYFAFEPGLDGFHDDAILNLRALNEQAAGIKGRVRREGDHFMLGGGEPVRFWAVNLGMENAARSRASVDYLAARLAKIGVNMVRFHAPLFDDKTPVGIDAKKLDELHYLVSALKKQGIYTTLSFYFPLWLDAEKQLGLKDFAGREQKHPFALVEFDPAMQTLYRGWAKAILGAKNPYTGAALADDPAVAIVEIQNEDSFFFWTFNDAVIPPAYWQELEQQFGGYLEKKFGSIGAAQAVWGAPPHPHDDATQHRAGIFGIWDMTAAGFKDNPAKQKRVGEQVRFLAQTRCASFCFHATIFFKRTSATAACGTSATDHRRWPHP